MEKLTVVEEPLLLPQILVIPIGVVMQLMGLDMEVDLLLINNRVVQAKL
jgi:hypothetical protein